ncbi:restriction endonuclease subunit S [Clostridium sp. LIBA-8841]|uniref:restriction endonuclease subunit S n=1 Tax=Clostridium sp. LIBA-8841 TaxID=2987530 RepID=UPI002AC39E71|nr:restriction endonuclease subunit S [Clostridium sp. LIBA-8841]MDZ5253771.1 restriction endonuclease subunit S [Clostridium sp. LIBA-8841]
MSKNVPKLRFKGFEDEWKKYKADDLFINISDKKHNGELNVLSVTQDKGVLLREELEIDIKFDVESVKNYKRVKAGDFIISLRSFQGGFEISNQEGLISPAYTVFNFKDSEKFNSKYFSYIFKSSRFIKKLAGLIYGVRDGKAISFTDFKTMTFFCPSLEEQEKIANFLSKVDSIIEKQEKKVEYWNSYKKGMMQKIFSQKIRFKDENGRDYPEWEEKKLGSVCSMFSGGTPASKNKMYYDGDIPFIRSAEINLCTTELKLSELGLKNSSAKMVDKGDLLYALYGATSGEVGIARMKGAINQAILCIKSKEIINCYLLNLLRYNKEKIIETYIQGGQGNLSAAIIKELSFNFPCLVEQNRIAKFLSNIDNIIEKENQKLEELRKWKKGLLQQMFV